MLIAFVFNFLGMAIQVPSTSWTWRLIPAFYGRQLQYDDMAWNHPHLLRTHNYLSSAACLLLVACWYQNPPLQDGTYQQQYLSANLKSEPILIQNDHKPFEIRVSYMKPIPVGILGSLLAIAEPFCRSWTGGTKGWSQMEPCFDARSL